MILPCTCKHAFQDKEYGNQKRLVTPTLKSYDSVGRQHRIFRCTVCGRELQK